MPKGLSRCLTRLEKAAIVALVCAALGTYLAPQATAAPAAPEVREAAVSLVGASSAQLLGRIKLNGAPATYYFQYGQASVEHCTPLACIDAPTTPAPVGGTTGEVSLTPQGVHGLTPATVYHYRLVAVAEIEGTTVSVDGPDQTFTTQPVSTFALPDNRQWEMVSPPEKQGARIAGPGERTASEGSLIQAAANGDAITFLTYAPTERSPSGYFGDVQVFAARGATGWNSWDLTVPHEVAVGGGVGMGNEYRFFSEDLSSAVLQPFGAFIKATPQEESEPLSPADHALAPDEASEQTAFVHTNYLNRDPTQRCERPLASCFRPIVTSRPGGNVPEGTVFGEEGNCPPETFCGPEFQGASANGAHVVVRMTIPALELTALYEWTGGSLKFVAEHAELGSLNAVHTRHAISDDGSRVFYVHGGNLYMRDLADEATLELDLPEAGCSGCGSGHGIFQTASSDGSRVFFTDTRPLTADAGATEAGKGSSDVYECRIVEKGGVPSCELSDLTPISHEGERAAVQGQVIGASEDGSWVYYVANGILENGGVKVPGAVSGGCVPERGVPDAACNLYVSHDGTTKLIAVLAGADNPDWGTGNSEAGLEFLVGSVSPNGEWLAFMSRRNLTGYNNLDAVHRQPDEEAYIYDARAGRVACASCSPTGALPHGQRSELEGIDESSTTLLTSGTWEAETWLSAILPTWARHRLLQASYQPRFLTNNGRLFFDSYDALVPQDANQTWDVYEYEPAGVGNCATSSSTYSESAGGCINAISSGTSPTESAFLDASADGGAAGEGAEGGGDVFFLTGAQLAKQDTDSAFDVYDARECAADRPCASAPVEETAPCSTIETCRPALSSGSPTFDPPASATYSGPGNSPSPPPAKAKSAAQIRKEQLARALRACKKRHGHKRRKTCEREARKRYGSAAAAKLQHHQPRQPSHPLALKAER